MLFQFGNSAIYCESADADSKIDFNFYTTNCQPSGCVRLASKEALQLAEWLILQAGKAKPEVKKR